MPRNDPRYDDEHDCLETVGGDESLLTPDGLCPKCDEARRVEEERRELQARRSDPQMHNMVDAQANAIDHSRSPSDFM